MKYYSFDFSADKPKVVEVMDVAHRVIKFRREGSTEWETAYTEKHLKLLLGKDLADKIEWPEKYLDWRGMGCWLLSVVCGWRFMPKKINCKACD